jgi:hypothetical protein
VKVVAIWLFVVQFFAFLENKGNLMPDFFLDVDPATIIKGHIKPDAPAAGGTPGGGVAKVFKAIEANLSTDLVAKVKSIYQFNVNGNDNNFKYRNLPLIKYCLPN